MASLFGGSSGVNLPSFGNVDLGGGLDTANNALDARYNQLGVGGGTAEASDLGFNAQQFGTQQAQLSNQVAQEQFALQSAQANQPSGLAYLAGLLG